MNTAKPNLYAVHLAFVGRIIAGACHEFKNHLGVTKELSGLLDDLLAVESKAPPGPERIAKITSGIEERVTAAAALTNHLSRFAHRMDQPLSSFSVNEVVAEIVYLSRRFARLKNVTLTMETAPELAPLRSNPSLLQFAVFSVIMAALDHLEKQGDVRITAGKEEERIQLGFQFENIRVGEISGPLLNPPLEVLQALHAEYFFARPDGTTARAVLLLSPIPLQSID